MKVADVLVKLGLRAILSQEKALYQKIAEKLVACLHLPWVNVRRNRALWLRLEPLEGRPLLATDTFTNMAGGSWFVASNWNLNRYPQTNDEVVIPALPGQAVVTYLLNAPVPSTAPISSLTLKGTLDLSGPLTVNGSISGGGTLIMDVYYADMLSNAIVASDMTVLGQGGQLNSVTMNSNLIVTDDVDVTNGLTLNGTVIVSQSDYSEGELQFDGNQTLGGTGTINFATSGIGLIYILSGNLTIAKGINIVGHVINITNNPNNITAPTGLILQGNITVAGSLPNDDTNNGYISIGGSLTIATQGVLTIGDNAIGGGSDITNNGTISLGTNTEFGVSETLINSGTIVFGDSSSITRREDTQEAFTQTSTGTITINVDEPQVTNTSTYYGFINASIVNLSGTLNASLVNGYIPTVGLQFNVVGTRNSTIKGAFSQFNSNDFTLSKNVLYPIVTTTLPDIYLSSVNLESAWVDAFYSISGNPGPFSIGLYQSAFMTFNSSAKLLQILQVGGSSTGVQFPTFRPANNLTPDPARPYLLIVTDPQNHIKESNENNNVLYIPYFSPDTVSVKTQPQPIEPLNSPFDVKIQVNNTSGQPDTSFSGPVTISLGTNATATLGGTLTENAVKGVADFPDLTINETGKGYTLQATAGVNSATTNGFTVAYTPTQIRQAYGFDQIPFLMSSSDPNYYNEYAGQGQTIAILGIGDYPLLYSDVNDFDNAFVLPYPPQLIKIGEDGGGFASDLPPADDSSPTGQLRAYEETMDVEWVHALAPAASIIVVECNTTILDGIAAASTYSGVSVVSMSYGDYTPNGVINDINYENTYHQFSSQPGRGITFVAASGDVSAAISYPAISPNVLSVGGTALTINSDGSYGSESGAANDGGGYSTLEPEPAYQTGVQTTGSRTFPDVAFDGVTDTGVAVYDESGMPSNPWVIGMGTSLGAPSWAALIALANQKRVNAFGSGNTLDGATQTLPTLYQLPITDFYKPDDFAGAIPPLYFDANNGTNVNGLKIPVNYNENTGLGTPKAYLIVPALALDPVATVSLTPTSSTLPSGNVGISYDTIIDASGGIGDKTFSYSITSSVQPRDLGFGFNERTNVFDISGTPSATGTVSFELTASDSVGTSTTQSYTLTVNPNDVTSQIGYASSGLVYNRSTQLFGGTIALTNISSSYIDGMLEVVFNGLPSGVTLANASGVTSDGNPYILIPLPDDTLAPGQTINFTVLFSNPKKLSFQYIATILNV